VFDLPHKQPLKLPEEAAEERRAALKLLDADELILRMRLRD
jgi:hypothetical protein